MNKSFLLAIVAALVAAPMALAHAPAGTPKNFCELPSERLVHDYGPVASGILLYGNEDGNVAGDCDPGFSFDAGAPCAGFDDPTNPFTFYAGLCDSHLNPPAWDWDGHNEFALGGAWLLVVSGNGERSPDRNIGAGTLYCFGAEGHHANHPTVTVDDLLFAGSLQFSVAADHVDVRGSGDGCGDFESTAIQDCVGSCTVTFPAGLDGSYVVYVRLGTQGHVSTD